ncbi:IclR family transcriptional regulator [Alkalihalobacillus sp. AL-G]|uniref:IclR family transcriptional regulator n=1 Tax=Alkalihalobacillus sp. AL-G TaxID=2926399 RepID=UPI0027297C2E|nr:IclR family transcriptional regulator [Alkalihalobacillus sp. AL-G]WLD93702.1 IclR family transcriptional regulator [Alkalihalobacillus sp. AL-G]
MSEVVRAVDRALEILNCFSSKKSQLSIGEICGITGLTKSTSFRLLASLEHKGFIEKDEKSHQYKLGVKLLELGNVVQESFNLRDSALPVMKDLAEKTGETVNVNIIQGHNRVCIEKIDGKHALRKVSEVGLLLPLYRGASGKLLLAFCEPDQIIEILNIAKDHQTPHDYINNLKIELFTIREKGYSTSVNERLDGTASVSAPIRDHTGNVIAGITISGPSIRFTDEKIAQFIEDVIGAGKSISSRLGYVVQEPIKT